MRVISGTAKGRRLQTPKSNEIRPVLDKVKGAIFNILFDVTGWRVLDLFAGTGAMGIEALSRGADFCVFVDDSREGCRLIAANLERCQFQDRGKIVLKEARQAIQLLGKRAEKFDLIFVDPPYEKSYVKKTLRQLVENFLLHEKTIIIIEHHPKELIPEIGGLTLTDQRKYGQTLVSFLKLS